MSLTAEITHLLRVLETDAGGSETTVDVSPITASLPGSLVWLTANQPLAVRLNDGSGLLLSGLYQLMLAMSTISALYLTPPASAEATVRIELVGGGTVTYSTPLP
jgi:hypothetical protein